MIKATMNLTESECEYAGKIQEYRGLDNKGKAVGEALLMYEFILSRTAKEGKVENSRLERLFEEIREKL